MPSRACTLPDGSEVQVQDGPTISHFSEKGNLRNFFVLALMQVVTELPICKDFPLQKGGFRVLRVMSERQLKTASGSGSIAHV